MAAPTLYLFDRYDERLGVLRPLGAVTHTEELCGEDTLELDCRVVPEKGDRLLWRDPDDGRWREHVVVRTDEPLCGPAHVYAEGSLCEMFGDFIEELHFADKRSDEVLPKVLSHTRWAVGDLPKGNVLAGCMLYHVNALAALRRVEGVWGCEAEARITVSGGRVAKREVSLPKRLGAWRGARFQYGRNLTSCTRTVMEDEVYTALYGFGKGIAILDGEGAPTGGYTRRLRFGEVNGGQDWVGDEAARERYGLWNADRTEKLHRFGQVIFPECEDKYVLMGKTRAALREACRPRVSYELDAALVEGAVPVGLGDEVAVVDTSRSPGWRVVARAVCRVRELGAGACCLTLGTVERPMWAATAEVVARVAAVEETATKASDVVASFEDLGTRGF